MFESAQPRTKSGAIEESNMTRVCALVGEGEGGNENAGESASAEVTYHTGVIIMA